MRRMTIFAVAGLLLLGGGAATAQQDGTKCVTTRVAGATIADLPGLLADAACLARDAASKITMQKTRLDKAAELAKTPSTPAPTPTPTPISPVGDQKEPELGKNLDKIPDYVPSNFDIAALIEGGWPPAKTGEPDTVGAFRFLCEPGDVKRDDPIVFPGQPGQSHLHQFFGNTGANAYSTYQSLRSTGESTCVNALNRSAYWIPAMLDGTGFVVRPDYVTIYYKRLPAGAAQCKEMATDCVDLPRALRFIFGYDMVTGQQPTGSAYFNCDGPTAKPGHYKTLAELAPNCGPGNRAGMIIIAPNCWDGVHLDSANHRDHVGYPSYWNNDGVLRCPKNMKYVIPAFTLASWYDVGPAGIGQPGSVTTWSLSSDSMNMGGKTVQMPAGSTAHGDWFGAWDEIASGLWHANCINKLLSCNAGDLGNGSALKAPHPFPWNAKPRLVPIPPVA